MLFGFFSEGGCYLVFTGRTAVLITDQLWPAFHSLFTYGLDNQSYDASIPTEWSYGGGRDQPAAGSVLDS